MPDTLTSPAMSGNADLRELGRFLAATPDCGQDPDIVIQECSRLEVGCAECEMNPANREG